MRILRSNSGFTLVEMLVTLMLLSVMVISVVTLLFVASHTNTTNADQSSANRQVQKQIELLRAASYYSLTNGTYSFTAGNINRLQSAQYVISDYADGTGSHPELKKIDVTISWYEGNVPKTVSEGTYIGQHGINQQ
jgi:prepilin-type N-terminal cleavage/methylation domain-containing protein